MKTGKLPENVLKRSVLRQLQTERKEGINGAGIGRDCAVFSFADGCVISCVQEGALAVRAGAGFSLGERTVSYTMAQLIQKCVNRLAASGAEPATVMIALILPETLEEPELKALMAEAAKACGELSVKIAGGQTRVMRQTAAPLAVITGFGRPAWRERASGSPFAAAVPGQDVVVSKWIGLEGTAILAKMCREKLLARYPEYLVEEAAGFHRYASVLPEAAAAMESGVCAMHNVSEGGIFAALWELAEQAGVGLSIELKRLPVRQETVEVCECCGVNPYQLSSEGCLVMTARDGEKLAEALNARQIPAVVVGKVTAGRDRLLFNGEDVSCMNRPARDELYRFLDGEEILGEEK